jgi:triacylglycerol lipase
MEPSLINSKMHFSLKTAAAAMLFLACSGDSPSGPTPPSSAPVASVKLSRDTATLVPGATAQIAATVLDATGQTLDRTVSWTSSDETKARVTNGIVTGVSPGAATITATAEGKTAQASVTIVDGGVVTANGGVLSARSSMVEISAPPGAVSQTIPIFVRVAQTLPTDPAFVPGTAYDLLPATTVFAQPVALALRYDAAALGAEIRPASLSLFTLVGEAWQPVAGSVLDANGRTVSAPVTRLGSYAIIGDLRVSRIDVFPPSVTLEIGGTTPLSATTRDFAGRILTGRSVVWSSLDESVARVNPATGEVTAVAPGTTTISATVEGVASTAQVTVSAISVATVEVSPGSASLYSGRSLQLTAAAKAVNGATLTDRRVTWSSSDAAVASVSDAGVVSGAAFGTARITATVEGKSASTTINVLHDPIVFVHGYNSSAAIWGTMIGWFVADGWPMSQLHTISYDYTQSNVTIADQVKTEIENVLSSTGAAKVDIVTHSMGALSSRYFIKNLGGGAETDAWVSLAGPNHGTATANLCGSPACFEMRPGSVFLTDLNAGDETPGTPRYATWWSNCDLATMPQQSVILSGATNTQTACLQHNQLYTDASVYQQVRDWVR